MRQVRTARRALSSPWSRACKCGPAPGAAQEHLPSCAHSPLPDQGWGVYDSRAPRSTLGKPTPAPPCHPRAASSPTLRVGLSPPHTELFPRLGPKGHTYLPRGLPIFVPPTRPRAAARRILFSHCFHCVIPEFKNPLGSLVEQDTPPPPPPPRDTS